MHQAATGGGVPSRAVIALVGQPNVGKSLIFRALTGRHVMVANYPGTTVEVSRGAARFRPEVEVVDTPGVVSLPANSEGEEVTSRLLLEGVLESLVHVGDAKNLRRSLLLTIQLAELGVPMVLALNMMDEARHHGLTIDERLLAERIGMAVVPTTATLGEGIANLISEVEAAGQPRLRLTYPPEIEAALAELATRLTDLGAEPRALALLWLAGDPVVAEWLGKRLVDTDLAWMEERRHLLQLAFAEPLSSVLHAARLTFVDDLADAVTAEPTTGPRSWRTRLGQATSHPVWGLPILALLLYALYWFVGRFGAGTLVDRIETNLFGNVINPWVTDVVTRFSPFELITDLLVGEYGLWTMGMTYAFALILPIVATFFFAFGALEDSGYFPRLTVLTNRVFRSMGLNGQAVVPMVLGLGCVTMATLTTRILETKRERMLVIFLLALAVPCSAQLGVVMGLLAALSFTATLIWAGAVLAVLLIVGWLAALLMPGERSPLLVELPPLRRPMLSNVLLKTVARVEWYLKEVVPIFLAGTAALFVLDRLDLLPRLIDAAEPLVVGWLGLPAAAATAFLMGFLRRDFGAAGLFALSAAGVLSAAQLVVAMVTITLFVPCIASVFMIAKERSWAVAGAVTAVIFPMAFLIGGMLSRGLSLVGWGA